MVGACLVVLCSLGCRSLQPDGDLHQVQRKPGYSLCQLNDDLAAIRRAHWPDRATLEFADEERWWHCLARLSRVFAEASWTRVNREAALRMLGPADGELAYRDVEYTRLIDLEGETRQVKGLDREPYLVEPSDDRLIYRTGDGHNHNTIYTLLFQDGKVSEVQISAGY